MNQKTKTVAITGAVIIALYMGATYFYKKSQYTETLRSAESIKPFLVKEHSPVVGDFTAPVEIVEFLDPECETCAIFYPLVKDLMKEYPGKIRLVVRYAPFHKDSIFALKILEAARLQNKYWETLSLFFERQPQWGSHHDPAPELIWNYLPELGLNINQIKTDMEKPEILHKIEADMEDVKALGISKTPTFYVNAQPLESFGYEQLRTAVLGALPE